MKGLLMRLFGRSSERHDPPVPLDEETVREEMTLSDPDYARARKALHDGRNLQVAARRQAILRELDLIREAQTGGKRRREHPA